MNTQSFERQLQQVAPPVPDPAARQRARHAALEEFRRLHGQETRKAAPTGWPWSRQWLGGVAAACVAVVGVSIYWQSPLDEREVRLPAPDTSLATVPATDVQRAGVNAPDDVVEPATALEVTTEAQGPTTAPPVEAPIPSGLLQHMDVQAGGSSTAPSSDNGAGDQEPVELASVEVTGTRIQHPNVTSANPIPSITGEEMRDLGFVNVADALTMLVPQNISTYQPGLTGDNQAGMGGGGMEGLDRGSYFIGNTIANLRGMDPALGTRTLTLIDGRRTVSTSNQADVVDMNIIPSNMLQRMGVVPGGDQFEHFDTNLPRRAAEEPVSTFSVDVDTTSYSFARRALNNGTLPAPGAVRAEEMINYFDYAWPAAESRREPFRPTVTVSDSPWGEGRKLIHVGIKGYELPARGKPDVNLVLLLDVSGSMNAPDRLPLATRSMKLLLDSLKPTDTVAIVVYAGAAGQVLAPTQVRDRESIEQALDSLRAGGSTAGAQGIRLAYQLAERNFREGGVNRILLATDGDFNVGVSDPDELKRIVERERAKGIFLSVLGFGRGNYRDDIAQALAQNGNGAAAYIDTLSEARKVLVHEATSSLFTIAGDVKIQIEFNPATVTEYRLVGYETRALNREDFNNDKVDAGDVGSGSTVTAIYEIAPVGSNAALMDERRYAGEQAPATERGSRASEYGFVKIRYKLPGEDQSQLIEQPIRVNTGVPRALRQDVAFSTAVAGFAQLLRGGQYTGALTYDDVLRLARSSTGEDPFGHRAEFVELVRSARDVQRASGQMAD